MSTSFIQLLVFGIIVAGANVAGGLILFPSTIHRNYKRFLKYILALSAGFMLAVTFIEILPKTIKLWQSPENAELAGENFYLPMVLLLAGYLLTQFFEHTIAPHFHLGEEVHSDHHIKPSSAYTAVGGLMIHTFFDGVSISAAAMLDYKVGILVFIAVFLHKFPEGFTIGSMVLAAGKGLREVLITTSIVGMTTLVGLLAFYFIGTNAASTLAYALPLACGVTLYVAASDLIPEVNHHAGKRPLVSLSVFAGVAVFFALHFLLHSFIEP
jgi:zinc transporter ZupT